MKHIEEFKVEKSQMNKLMGGGVSQEEYCTQLYERYLNSKQKPMTVEERAGFVYGWQNQECHKYYSITIP